MDLFQGATPIASLQGRTTFGSITAGTTKDVTFTIKNTGIGSLLLPATHIVAITGDDEFSTVASVPANSIAGSGSDTFDIRFSPADVGTYSATVSIANNDSNENPYTFTISGTATAAAQPEIEVLQGTTPVLHGSTYDAGGMTVGASPVDIVFTISNIGSAALNLTRYAEAVALTGDGEFTLFT